MVVFKAYAQVPTLVFEPHLSNKVEHSLTISPDKRTIYFVKTDSFYVSKPKAIYKSKLSNGQWSDPQKVSFSGEYSDSSPFLTTTGDRLFFTSLRPVNGVPAKSNNIWYVDIIDGKEGVPIYLSAVNSEESDYSPSLDKYENLYFGSYRSGGHGSGDLWWSEFKDGIYQKPENLGGIINSEFGEWGSCISPNGKFIIFENSGKSENQSAAGDLYVAYKENRRWTQPIHLNSTINSVGSDLTPKIHGNTLYFASNRENDYESVLNWNNVDLYSISLIELLNSVQVESSINFKVNDFFRECKNVSASVSWLYYNKDKFPDVYIGNAQNQNNQLYINQSGRGFERTDINNITNDTSSTSAAAWTDFDNDGDQDVLLANQHGEDNRLYVNNTGDFELYQIIEKGDTYHGNWVDYNNDGLLDCFVSNAQSGTTQLYQQENHEFRPLINEISRSKGFHSGASWVDLNKDNLQDLYLPIAGSSDEFYVHNSEISNFGRYDALLGNTVDNIGFTSGISFGDYDNDKDLDGFLSNLNHQKNSLIENVNGVFQNVDLGLGMDMFSTWTGLWGDYDNDGDLDIIVTNYDQPNSIFENKCGYFRKVEIPNVTDKTFLSSGAAWGDYNRDGFLDVTFANWAEKENLFIEGIPNDNNWVIFKLVGTKSNKDAIGAKVTLKYGEHLDDFQYREIQSNMGLRSYPQRIAHFGLGDYKDVVKVEVLWPSGESNEYVVPVLNRYYKIVEGNSQLVIY